MFNRRIPGFAPETLASMERYDWPGNIRELHNEIQRMVVLCDDDAKLRPRPALASDLWRLCARSAGAMDRPVTLKERVEELERGLIAAALERQWRQHQPRRRRPWPVARRAAQQDRALRHLPKNDDEET